MIVYVFIIKKLWSKCKKLWINKFIFGYRVSYSSIKKRTSEHSPVKVFSHIVDFENLFPDNPLLKNDHMESKFYRDIKSVEFCFLLNVYVCIFLHGFHPFWLSFIYFSLFFFMFKISNALFLGHLGFTLLFCSNIYSSHWPKLNGN